MGTMEMCGCGTFKKGGPMTTTGDLDWMMLEKGECRVSGG